MDQNGVDNSRETFHAMKPNVNLKPTTVKSEILDVEMKPKQPSFDVDVTNKDVDASKKVTDDTNGKVDVGKGKNKVGRMMNSGGAVKYSRIFKKVSPDGNMILFLPQREIMVTETKVEPLMGVALIHQV